MSDMKQRETVPLTAEEEAAGVTRRPRVYVVELDAMDLPEFYERKGELVPAINRKHIDEIFNGDRGYGGKSWYGEDCASWDDAKRLIREGWPKGVERASKLAAKLEGVLPEPESARRRPRWNDDDSGELDRDRLYTTGVETAFRGTTRVRMRAPRVIRIAANWAINCSYSADQIAWNGAAITALLDTLERADYSTELTLGFATRHGDSHGTHMSMPIIRVKTAGEPLSMNAISAVAGHAGIYRSYGFAALCSTPNKVFAGLGFPQEIRAAWKHAAAARVVELPDCYMELAFDEDQAIEQMVGALRQVFPDTRNLPITKAEARRIAYREQHIKAYGKAKYELEKASAVKASGLEYWESLYGREDSTDAQ